MKIPKFGAPPLLFRADTREQSEIKAQGFQAVNPYSLKDAKTDVKDIFTGGNIMTLWVQNGPSSVGNKWISTADERECMGFTSGRNVYVIKIDNLQEVNIDETVLCLDSNQAWYLQLISSQYFISNKSGIWSLSLIVHSKG